MWMISVFFQITLKSVAILSGYIARCQLSKFCRLLASVDNQRHHSCYFLLTAIDRVSESNLFCRKSWRIYVALPFNNPYTH
jgi:hypothetical protein